MEHVIRGLTVALLNQKLNLATNRKNRKRPVSPSCARHRRALSERRAALRRKSGRRSLIA